MKLFKISALIFILFIFGANCARLPYTIQPHYYETESQISKIAVYPLLFIKEGEEPRNFGAVFEEKFYQNIQGTQYKQPVEIIMPKETVSLLDQQGITVESTIKNVFKSAPDLEFPYFRPLTETEIQALQPYADAIIITELTGYNEVEASSELAQVVLTSCLTGGMASYSEKNFVSLRMLLISTKDGSILWEYKPVFSESLRKQAKTRQIFTDSINVGFISNFPLSARFLIKGR